MMEQPEIETTMPCPDHNVYGGTCYGTLVGEPEERDSYRFVCAVCGQVGGHGRLVRGKGSVELEWPLTGARR